VGRVKIEKPVYQGPKDRFKNDIKNKSLFTLHTKLKCPFMHHKKAYKTISHKPAALLR